MRRVALPLLLAITLGCRPGAPPDEEALIALSERTLEVWNEGRFDIIDEIYSPDYVRHEPDIYDDRVGTEALKEWIVFLRTAYPDFTVSFEDSFTGPERVVVRWSTSGTNTGRRGDLPPTGNRMRIHGVSVLRVDDGRVAEEWVNYNLQAVFEQLGVRNPELRTPD